jgi:hypothetical protein
MHVTPVTDYSHGRSEEYAKITRMYQILGIDEWKSTGPSTNNASSY